MKTLLTVLLLTTLSNTIMATTPIDPSHPGFAPCSEGDLNLLQAATVRGNKGVVDLVRDYVLPEQVTCFVEKPRFFHPEVCGAAITQVDTFKLRTEQGGTFTIVVDSSYRSCFRMRIIPMIKSLEFRPVEVTYFP